MRKQVGRTATGAEETATLGEVITEINATPLRVHTHAQAMAATTWTIVHNLGTDPAGVLVLDADGVTVLEGFGVAFTAAGVALRLSFDIPVAGTARLS